MRITEISQLPEWLALSLLREWAAAAPGGGPPSLGGPSYVVYHVEGTPLWYVDSPVTGRAVYQLGGSTPYGEITRTSPARVAVEAELRACADAAAIEALWWIIRGRGGDHRALDELILRMRAEACPDDEIVRRLAGTLYYGLSRGVWPRGG